MSARTITLTHEALSTIVSDAVSSALAAYIAQDAPAKTAHVTPEVAVVAPVVKVAHKKTLTRAMLAELKAAGKVPAGMTRTQALEIPAIAKKFQAPTGAARLAVKAHTIAAAAE